MLNITIDGMAGSGKSTLADKLAKKLNLAHFNTGNVYRAIACHYLFSIGDNVSEKLINSFVKNLDVKVWFEGDNQVCNVNGNDYSKDLRTEKTSGFVSKISPFVQIREIVRKIQREFAKKNNCVMEGRDIGRVVLKNANVKLFLTASPEVRAKRRFDQLKGNDDFESILQEIKQRDFEDIHREEGALIPAEDAIIIDTSFQTLQETTDQCLKIVAEKCKNGYINKTKLKFN